MKEILLIGDLAGFGGPNDAEDYAREQREHRGADAAKLARWVDIGGMNYAQVSPGETMWSIAGELTGDPRRWSELWAAQAPSYRAIRDPSHLVTGDILEVPTSMRRDLR